MRKVKELEGSEIVLIVRIVDSIKLGNETFVIGDCFSMALQEIRVVTKPPPSELLALASPRPCR